MDLIFVDANVLFSRTLRDWTLMLGQECNRFAVISSRDCLVEVIANIRERNPAAEGGMISHIHDLIEHSLHDLITKYPGGPINGMPDEKDWHVVHAATEAGAKILVTSNMKDFAPAADLLPFDLYSPDELFDLVWKNDPRAVEDVTIKQLRYWKGEAKRYETEGRPAPKGLAQALHGAGATGFADIITQTLRKLSGEKDSPAPCAMADPNSDPDPAEAVPSTV
ncbi:PIN domain-containing protein [Agreia pratensis]|uniref:PIN domain-containing protein n=1 Tax=Agreia pratensis TaxID=150121 RepID=UPI00188C0DC6|nr:PIN domain-containing protein [Agreia pratensis]MBF4636209.1 PIN domain-containing protein [Agreia pratensis]